MTDRCVVISIDMEMRWGVCDHLPLRHDAYLRNLEGVEEVVPATLELFRELDIGATWAIVGALGCEGWDEYSARAPSPPRYDDVSLRFSPEYRRIDPRGRLHFAPKLIRAIAATPQQEVASHTFGHIYLREPGCTADDVRADARATATVLGTFSGEAISSLVFPRNQVGYTSELRAEGIERWRENPRSFFWQASAKRELSPIVRGLRLIDAFVPLAHRGALRREVRASHFVRFGLPGAAWKTHVARIVRDGRLLGPGGALHLWWHPHNLGADVRRSIDRLHELLVHLGDTMIGASFVSMRDGSC